MYRVAITLAGLITLATMSPASAGGLVGAADLEHARANARAGGPVSEHDAELLERWGCLSGTNNKFCQDLERKQRWQQSGRRHVQQRKHVQQRRHNPMR